MPGVDEAYVNARRVLLDALDALEEHRSALILVGAQAIYLHTGAADFGVAEFTTDADLALDPDVLASAPPLEDAMLAHGFHPELDQFGKPKPGIWRSAQGNIEVDLMVPNAVGGSSRRGVSLPGHDHLVARKAKGLEAALIDHELMTIAALEPSDLRTVKLAVAGPAALLIAKLHKIAERLGQPSRQEDKDALDVYRLLKATDVRRFADAIPTLMYDIRSAEVTKQALISLRDLFATDSAPGSQMAARNVPAQEERATIAASCAVLAEDLLKEINS